MMNGCVRNVETTKSGILKMKLLIVIQGTTTIATPVATSGKLLTSPINVMQR